MADKIFINYRRDDSASHALAVAQYFETEFGKSNIFIDVERLREGLKFKTVPKLGQCTVGIAPSARSPLHRGGCSSGSPGANRYSQRFIRGDRSALGVSVATP